MTYSFNCFSNNATKQITREQAKVDRIACPWLIKNFVDIEAKFLFVPGHKVFEVMKNENAIPFDITNVELGHHGNECSFDAIIKNYELDRKNLELAKIIRGADTEKRQTTPQSEGLAAIAAAFNLISNDDYENMTKQFPLYDALYAFAKSDNKEKLLTSRH